MKIQYVSICPTQESKEHGCLELTPELLAATGARYSRNNEGLDVISSKIDYSNLNKSVDGIFKMLDYGHASIADMTPIALFIDGISQFAAYYLWTLSPTAGGQECSTRYIKLDPSGLVDVEDLGIPSQYVDKFNTFNRIAFENYKTALHVWTKISDENPELTKIPKSLLESTNPKDVKTVERMKRNFAFDRARCYLPLAASTGVMMLQSARAWANIAAHLQSHSLRELNLIGKQIAEQMSIGAPRLMKHTKPTDTLKKYIQFERDVILECCDIINLLGENETLYYLDLEKLGYEESLLERSCSFRSNRYSPFGCAISRMSVKFAWEGISFGEIRDLNRHRTGNKYCPLYPLGFYGSTDQSDNPIIRSLYESFEPTTVQARELFKECPEYIYFTALGHKYYFEHTTTADKFLYEMELRTGIGAHYKYAEHCRETLKKWFEEYPETKGLIFEGSAEPE